MKLPAFIRGLVLIFFTALAGSLFAQNTGTVPAYFFADASAPIAASLPANSVVLEDAIPVEGLEGWESIEYEATFEGFVDPVAIRADSTIEAATLIYSSDRPDSTVLAESDPRVAVKVLERGPLWSQIRTTQRVTLFVPVGPAAFAGGSTAAAPASGQAPASTQLQPLPNSTAGAAAPGNDTIETFNREEGLQSIEGDLEPIEGSGAASGGAVAGTSGESENSQRAAPTPPTQPQQLAPAAALSRTFFGTLRERKTFFGRRKDPRYALFAPDGDLLANVDLSNALIFGSVDSYLGRRVVVQGVPKAITGRPGVVIQARTLHLN
ncbi:MAG: hypothetical protein ACFBZ8_01890 [Opitutales bacterium]